MMSFSIPRLTADRLIRLGLACADEAGVLGNIGVRVTSQAVRLSATNGRILASLVVPIDHLVGTTGDIILDQEQLTAALKSAAKAPGGRITFTIDDHEARVTNGEVSTIVRRISGTFPNTDHVWERTVGKRWIPTTSSIDSHLAAMAQKITGHKNAILFSSPVHPDSRLDRLWSVTDPQHDERVGVSSLREAVKAPAYWSDHELAILIMPITRGDADRQLDLSAHTVSLPKVAALAA